MRLQHDKAGILKYPEDSTSYQCCPIILQVTPMTHRMFDEFLPGKDSATPLFLAARGGQLPCLMQLLAANAELQRQNDSK